MNPNPRLSLPVIPKEATHAEIIAAIGASINDQPIHEETARNFVIRCLSALGNQRTPQVYKGMIGGATVRLYKWTNSPVGDVILAVGPQFMPKFVAASSLTREAGPGDIYTLASPDHSRHAERAVGYSGQLAARHSTQVAAEVVAAAPKAPAPARAPAPTAPARAPKPAPAPRAAAPRSYSAPPAPEPAPASYAAPPAPGQSAEAAERAELKSFMSDLLK